jgi:hypothetical protein
MKWKLSITGIVSSHIDHMTSAVAHHCMENNGILSSFIILRHVEFHLKVDSNAR